MNNHINIIFSKSNGLTHDANVFASIFMKHKYIVHFNANLEMHFDIIVFLEHILENYLEKYTCCMFVPNVEWLTNSDTHLLYHNHLHTILCKTHHSFEIMSKLIHSKSVYCGMTSLLHTIENKKYQKRFEFLHVKGTSMYKNTQILIDAWLKHPEWPILHIVCRSVIDLHKPIFINNIILYQYELSNEELYKLQNTCMVHICPSYCEGFGHYINEGRLMSSLIITTNAPPMNELVKHNSGLLINPIKSEKVQLFGNGYIIGIKEIEDIMYKLLNMNFRDIDSMRKKAFDDYINDTKNFEKTLLNIINEIEKIYI
uniref:Glycosyl transferase family 1 domain-containing protein n=1 Tax=viral metagenome TaxID=1070528 RepID=A0A6C0F5C9_9ZZZZ|tara:strand:+ start:16453 stop:17394 length:942 start_codon:yes stop_codon:yes gene_type:complete